MLLHSVRQTGQLAQLAARAFATAAVEVAGNPFLRYSNPFPVAIDHTPLLSSIPETQVRARGNQDIVFGDLDGQMHLSSPSAAQRAGSEGPISGERVVDQRSVDVEPGYAVVYL